MTNEEQARLWESYALKHEKAVRDTLITLYLPLSRSIARKFTGRGMELDDLEQIASIALIRAVEHFNSELGFKFITYAVPQITGAIRHELRNKNGTFRLSRDSIKLLRMAEEERSAFEQREMRTPTAQELADILKLPVQDFLTLLYMNNNLKTFSMDAPVSEEEEMTLASLLGREEEGFYVIEKKERYSWLLSHLNEQEKQLVKFRYEDELNQRETAARLGISQMQVSRVERRILQKLKNLLDE